MEMNSTFINRAGFKYRIHYKESDPLQNLGDILLQGVHAFCFYNDKLVLVNHPKNGWVPPGGGIDPGETYEQAVVREVKEETNMRVISQKLIGYVDIEERHQTVRQTRSVCIVEPYGEFIPHHDEEITEIKCVDPKDAKHYFDWGEIGDHIMKRAIELKEELK